MASSAGAAIPNPPNEDIDYLLEHVPEAAQDARFYALPWPEELTPGRWELFAAAGWSAADVDFLRERGGLASFGGSYGFSAANGVGLFGFYDAFTIDGEPGEQVLNPRFVAGVPLDLPERARFSNPRGEVRHYGVGASWLHRISPPGARRPWILQVGALVNRLEVSGYELDFELLGGRDVGARGVLDRSSRATFVTPWVGVERRFLLGAAFELRPRLSAGLPLPPGDYDGRIRGNGFELSSTEAGGRPGKIGDGFFGLGAGLLHRRSGLELELGGALTFPVFEITTHAGVDQAYLLHLTWHLPQRP